MLEGILCLHHNGIFEGLPRVGELFRCSGEDGSDPVQVTIRLPPKQRKRKGFQIDAGQSVNIYIPSLGLRSKFQTHPFVVASWTGKRPTELKLLIEPRGRWTQKLQSRASTESGQTGGLGWVIFTGPHGTPVPIEDYEYVVMVADGYGIVAQLPLLERLVQGALAREVRSRRIRLVWEFQNIGESYLVRIYLSDHMSPRPL